MYNPELDNQRTRLIQKYNERSQWERAIVQFLSVLYEPISRNIITDCLARLKLHDENGKPFNQKNLKGHLERWLAADLLIQPSGQGVQCNPLISEVATRDALREGRFEAFVQEVQRAVPIKKRWQEGPRQFRSPSQLMREVRIGLYRHDLEYIRQQVDDYNEYNFFSPVPTEVILLAICTNPFDGDWFCTLPAEIYENLLGIILVKSAVTLSPAQEPFTLLWGECSIEGGRCSDSIRMLLVEQLLLRGRLQEAEKQLTYLRTMPEEDRTGREEKHLETELQWGWLLFLKGENDRAIAHFTNLLQAYKKQHKKRKFFFNSFSGLFFILALLKDGSPDSLRQATEYANFLASQSEHWLQFLATLLAQILQVQQGDLSRRDTLKAITLNLDRCPLTFLFEALCIYWADKDTAKKRLMKLLGQFYRQVEAAEYTWLVMETAELLGRLRSNSHYTSTAATLRETCPTTPLPDLIATRESWELCLDALANLNQELQTATPTADRRMVWFITLHGDDGAYGWSLQPKEQKVGANGAWSKGRPIALKRLGQNPGEFEYLTTQDLRVCAHIQAEYEDSYSRYSNKVQYVFDRRAIAALIGHPLVFWEDASTTRLEIVKGQPELLVKKDKKKGWLSLEFSPKIQGEEDILVVKETPTQLKVIEVDADHRRIADIIGEKNQLMVPETAQERVLAAINTVSSKVVVHSDIGGEVANAEEVTADTKPHVHLLPAGEGLKVAVLARPFAGGGPYFRPGQGGETVVAEIEGKRYQTTRSLPEEKKRSEVAIAACPTLTRYTAEDGEWIISDPEDCLELLLELQELGDNIVLEHPQGEKFRVAYSANSSQFRVSIQRQRDWFAASGELQLSDDLVLNMQQLLDLLEKTPGRFVPLGDGEFVALTQSFRKRLDELRAFSDKHGKGVRFHPLAAAALDDFMEEVGEVKADKHWREHLQRLKEVKTLEPEVPSTLQAELRDYQVDGFCWLARLAHWGVGACLADDMGLGKTLQALAVILTRAPEGPTLIVAPTSVAANWIDEAQRFAPTLRTLQFGIGNRQAMLDNLQPFDMVVCSYGLLQQEEVAEMLTQVEWQTIVLDEAQAIKNAATKRSQAAMKLQGQFKLITTGTPIENHLGELWSLFRFINPGLLGSANNFNQRFANPIERGKDKQVRNQLKKLIQPFILRRTKNQVLEELPARTEITLHVELSREEKALYEALRREAIAKLTEGKGSDGAGAQAGAQHLQVLAELMKLRRVCCNARLVMPEADLPSAKLTQFGEVLGELLENRHKALVFSQFVDHLTILREYLDAQQIRYQYLDGSTPAGDRRKRVNAFQSGEGDVFLISLKAGGVGLNLTAADYVIHMDPWWNPAVEDQASDRAHRIGQQRPVTIYRLVAKDTIEEKIVDLHRQKRDLADSLLEGTDMSGKVSTDELLQLIREQ